MGKKFDNILGTIGRTPVVRINKLAPAARQSVREDRGVQSRWARSRIVSRWAIIEDAERSGTLRPGQTVIEATSGNTGIGLAMVCAQKGYPLVVTMAENFSVERRKMMRFLGAKVVLTPAALKGSGMLAKAVELAETHGWFLCRQFENEANADMHSRTTAPEILEAFEGEKLDLLGHGLRHGRHAEGRRTRPAQAERPETKIIVCEPDNSQTPRQRHSAAARSRWLRRRQSPSVSPASHAGLEPGLHSEAHRGRRASMKLVDQILPINGAEAMKCSRDLAQKEGIFVGITAGATFAGALRGLSARQPQGANVLCMLPDTAERYLSTPLFADIPADMTDEEMQDRAFHAELSLRRPASTPAPGPAPAQPQASAPPPQPQAISAPPPVEADAAAFVENVVNNREQPVVMFALEWCEFCWSVRRMFGQVTRFPIAPSISIRSNTRRTTAAAISARRSAQDSRDDDPADLRRWRVRGWLHGRPASLQGRAACRSSSPGSRRQIRRVCTRRSVRLPAGVAASSLRAERQTVSTAPVRRTTSSSAAPWRSSLVAPTPDTPRSSSSERGRTLAISCRVLSWNTV